MQTLSMSCKIESWQLEGPSLDSLTQCLALTCSMTPDSRSTRASRPCRRHIYSVIMLSQNTLVQKCVLCISFPALSVYCASNLTLETGSYSRVQHSTKGSNSFDQKYTGSPGLLRQYSFCATVRGNSAEKQYPDDVKNILDNVKYHLYFSL